MISSTARDSSEATPVLSRRRTARRAPTVDEIALGRVRVDRRLGGGVVVSLSGAGFSPAADYDGGLSRLLRQVQPVDASFVSATAVRCTAPPGRESLHLRRHHRPAVLPAPHRRRAAAQPGGTASYTPGWSLHVTSVAPAYGDVSSLAPLRVGGVGFAPLGRCSAAGGRRPDCTARTCRPPRAPTPSTTRHLCAPRARSRLRERHDHRVLRSVGRRRRLATPSISLRIDGGATFSSGAPFVAYDSRAAPTATAVGRRGAAGAGGGAESSSCGANLAPWLSAASVPATEINRHVRVRISGGDGARRGGAAHHRRAASPPRRLCATAPPGWRSLLHLLLHLLLHHLPLARLSHDRLDLRMLDIDECGRSRATASSAGRGGGRRAAGVVASRIGRATARLRSCRRATFRDFSEPPTVRCATARARLARVFGTGTASTAAERGRRRRSSPAIGDA